MKTDVRLVSTHRGQSAEKRSIEIGRRCPQMQTWYSKAGTIEVNMASIETRIEKLEKQLSLEKAQAQGIVIVYDEDPVPEGLPPGTSIVRFDSRFRNL